MTNQRASEKYRIALGALVLFLALFSVGQAVYNQHVKTEQEQRTTAVAKQQISLAQEQRRCLQQVIQDLTHALALRSKFVQQQDSTKDVLIRTVFKATTPQEARHAFLIYNNENARIDDQLKKHPIPPYPTGICVPHE